MTEAVAVTETVTVTETVAVAVTESVTVVRGRGRGRDRGRDRDRDRGRDRGYRAIQALFPHHHTLKGSPAHMYYRNLLGEGGGFGTIPAPL